MTADNLKTIRQALGLSVADMAAAVGLSGDNAATHIRAMEGGSKPITGPMAVLLRYMQQAVEIDADSAIADLTMRVLPRYLDCSDLEHDDGHVEIVMHTRWPRFYGLLTDELASDDIELLQAAGVPVVEQPAAAGLGLLVVIFIDTPTSDPMPVIFEAARLKTEQASRDLQ
jgi:transcriptional regulator with XRE-family HTH domain